MKDYERVVFQQDAELGGQIFVINDDTVFVVEKQKDGEDHTAIKISEISPNYYVKSEIMWGFFIATLIMIAFVVIVAWVVIKYVVPSVIDLFPDISYIVVIFATMLIGAIIFYYSYHRCRPIEVACFKNKYDKVIFKIYRPFDKWWEYDDFIKILDKKIKGNPEGRRNRGSKKP